MSIQELTTEEVIKFNFNKEKKMFQQEPRIHIQFIIEGRGIIFASALWYIIPRVGDCVKLPRGNQDDVLFVCKQVIFGIETQKSRELGLQRVIIIVEELTELNLKLKEVLNDNR